MNAPESRDSADEEESGASPERRVAKSRLSSLLDPAPSSGEAAPVRWGLRQVILAWAFGAVFYNVTTSAPFAAYARLLGANDFDWGIISAAPMAGAVSQILSSMIIERTRRRKPVFMIAGLIHRLMWLPIAFLPWVLPPHHRITVLALVIMSVTSNLSGHMVSPAFMSWMSDYVPIKVRGAFFAERMRIGTIMALISSMAAGAVLDWRPGLMTYTLVLSVASLCGAADILHFRKLPEPAMLDAEALPPLRVIFREPFRNESFRRFLAFSMANAFSVSVMGPSLWIFAMEVLNLSKLGTNLTLLGAYLAMSALVSPFWGRLSSRYGNLPVLKLTTILLAFTPIPWMLSTPASAHWMWIVVAISGAVGAGSDLTNLNLSFSLFPKYRQSLYFALLALLVGVSAGIAPVIGGALVDGMKTSPVHLFHRAIPPYAAIFGLSTILRFFTALVLLPRVIEPGSHSMGRMLRRSLAEAAMQIRSDRR